MVKCELRTNATPVPRAYAIMHPTMPFLVTDAMFTFLKSSNENCSQEGLPTQPLPGSLVPTTPDLEVFGKGKWDVFMNRVCMCVSCVSRAYRDHRDQKRASDHPLVLELQVFVSHLMGYWDPNLCPLWELWVIALNHWTISSALLNLQFR